MALITCKECGQTISDKAKSCPNCGCPVGDYQGQTDRNNNSNETNCNNSNVIGTKKYSVTIPLIIGLALYIVLTILLSNVGNTDIEIAINTCTIIGTIVALCIAKSNVDRLIYIIVNVIIAVIAHKFWKELLYGTAVVVVVTNISIIVVSALKRNKPTSISKKVDLYATWFFRLLPIALLTLY